MSAANPPQKLPARSQAIDALRGFALCGIVIVNAPFFAWPAEILPPVESLADATAFWFTGAFAMGKFFLIFSFLFGFGFATILLRAAAEQRPVASRFARRLMALFTFGLLHAAYLFFGDILMLYALLGVALWFCRNWSARSLLVATIAIYIFAILSQTLVLTDAAVVNGSAAIVPGEGYLGGFRDAAAQRLRDLPLSLVFIGAFNGPAALAMFLAGLAAGKSGFFPPSPECLKKLRPWTYACLLIGGLGSGTIMGAIMVIHDSAMSTASLSGYIAMAGLSALAPILSFGMTMFVLDIAARSSHGRLTQWLATAGSSSLSGYILHSIMLGAVFFGWGLGLYGTLNAGTVLAIGLATFVVVVLLLNLWKRWFRFGPDEWLLRSFVDLQWKPILK